MGILEVTKDALVKGTWGSVVVAAPADATGSLMKGDGWTLELQSGWMAAPAERNGDLW